MNEVRHQSIEVRLNISGEEYQKLYQGVVQQVAAIAVDGRRVQFPARILQRFVGHQGVHGRFVIYFDEAGKFSTIEHLR